MAETIVFAETQYTGFAYSQDHGAYMYVINPAPFTIAAGENYIVMWDNKDYPCTATAIPDGSLVMGNLSLAGIDGGNPDAPFIIGWAEVGVSLFSSEDKDSHTVAIYQVVEEEEPSGNVILAEQILSGFITEDEVAVETTIPLVVGETYSIEWDGTVYECVGQDLSAVGEDGVVAIGNLTGAGNGLVGNNEPFSIGYVPASLTGSVDILSLVCCAGDCESDTHTVAIYQVIEDEEPETPEEPEGIVLKDRNGKDVAYYGIETVTFDTTTKGKQQVYTKGVAVEGLEIVPDFSGGDMTVTAPEGALVKSAIIKKPVTEELLVGETEGSIPMDFTGDNLEITPSSDDKFISKVTIEKPENLVPENIAEGVDIAGIVGTFAGGAVKIASGTFTSTSTNTITHNLGVVPDILILFPTSNSFSTTTTYTASMMWGCSTAFKAAYSFFPSIAYPCRMTASDIRHYYYSRCIDQGYDSGYPNVIRDTNATTFTVNRASTAAPSIPANTSMRWIAIGGLT